VQVDVERAVLSKLIDGQQICFLLLALLFPQLRKELALLLRVRGMGTGSKETDDVLVAN
jgi:hypothetical protein